MRSLWVRIPVTLGLLALVALQVDWSKASNRISNGRWGWFVAAVLLLVAYQVVGSLRWGIFLRLAQVPVSSWQTLRAFAIGVFTNNFLPTSFGGDAVRAWIVGRAESQLVRALTSVLADRVTGIWCLLTVGWIGLLTDVGAVPGSLLAALVVASVAVVAGTALLLRLAASGGRRFAARLPEPARLWEQEFRGAVTLLRADPRAVIAAVALGLVFQAAAVTVVWMVARAIELRLAYSLAAVAAPLILLITLVPISIAGFGVREGGTVLVLGTAGISATDATLLSLIGVGALVIASLPGGLAMLTSAGQVVPTAADPPTRVAPGRSQSRSPGLARHVADVDRRDSRRPD